MKKYTIESSNIKDIAYDLDSKILVVTFKSNSSYSYKDIDPETICKIMFSDSVGSTFHDQIVKKYKGVKNEG